MSIGATAGRYTGQQVVVVGPTLAWTLLVPFDIDLNERLRTLSVFWIAAVFLPVGYWVGRAVDLSSGERLVLMAAPLLIGLAAVPRFFASPVTPWPDWLGAVAGLLLGLRLSSFLPQTRGLVSIGETKSETTHPSRRPL